MGCEQKKADRLYIAPRDKSIVAKAKPALGRDCSHRDQVMNAFVHGFSKYNKALKELSKV